MILKELRIETWSGAATNCYIVQDEVTKETMVIDPAGDVEKIFSNLMEKKQVYPDVIIVDPPRKGLDNNTINNILAVKPKKIVYISCNPATMVRDMKLLSENYEIGNIQPVDMFPFTSHVECVSLLCLK